MAHLLVIGSPSLDKIHINGQVFDSVGGAGLYVAMAAVRSGVKVSLFSPRPGQPPDVLQEFAENLEEWIGPVIPLADIPRFEIKHKGDKATYVSSSSASESGLDPNAMPADLSVYDAVHITAMGDSAVQSAFYDVCRERGAKCISLGTWIGSIGRKPLLTRELLDKADFFFMNEEEALALFGDMEKVKVGAGQVLFVTRAEKGALVLLGAHQVSIPGYPVMVKDPTGAGESFCGGTLANILQGVHPVIAGMRGGMLAAEKVADWGAGALFEQDAPPSLKLDPRIEINQELVKTVSGVVRNLPEADPFNFVGEYLPPEGHPYALDYFFAVILQQFSFWEMEDGRYKKPLITSIGGQVRKGSSYLFYAFSRLLDQDPGFFSPERQASIRLDEMAEVFRADDGSMPMPALALHLAQANQYGRDMLALDLTPHKIMAQINGSSTPLKSLLALLDHIGGYKEDPLRKKSNLLALTLNQRPERFLTFGVNEAADPVVDYHVMRSMLRIGLVEILDNEMRQKLSNRQVVSPAEEWAVRYAAYQVQKQVEGISGKPIGAVDWFFFNYMRSHCPEMTEPVCENCVLDPICSKYKELFQPVLRTTYY